MIGAAPRCLIASWPSYFAYFATPAILVAIGVMAAQRVRLNAAELTAFFLLPCLVMIVAVLKLALTRICIEGDAIILVRMNVRRLCIERIHIQNSQIISGVLTKSYLEKEKIKEISGMKIVPWSLLYLEYNVGSSTRRVAFDVSMFDSTHVETLVRPFENIAVRRFGRVPGP